MDHDFNYHFVLIINYTSMPIFFLMYIINVVTYHCIQNNILYYILNIEAIMLAR